MEEEWRRELALRRHRSRGALGGVGWMLGAAAFGLLLLPAMTAGLHLEETFRGLDRTYVATDPLWDQVLHAVLVVCQGPGPMAERNPMYGPLVWAVGVVGWALLGLIASAIWAWVNGPTKGAGM